MSVRHPSVQHLVDLLEPNSNLPEHMLAIAQRFSAVRDDVLGAIRDDNPEVSAGLRKLLEAKDCFVRAAHLVVQQGGEIYHDALGDSAKSNDVANSEPSPEAPTA